MLFYCWTRSNISGAAAVAECLILLSRSMEWKATVAMTIGGVLEKPPELLDLSGIFGLLVTAGFPKVRHFEVLSLHDHTHSYFEWEV